MHVASAVFVILFPVLGAAILFTFIGALLWLGARRNDRQAFYLSEMIKRISESSGSSAADFLREYERSRSRRRREGLTIAGLVGSLAAVGLMVFLHGIAAQLAPLYLVGLIPLLPSVGMLIYARFLGPLD